MARHSSPPVVTFYHDIEQDLDSDARPERCREIVKEFLAVEARWGVHATYNVAGKLLAEQPDLAEWITRDGHEIAFHSYDHRRDWQASHSSAQIDDCRATSTSIRGYRSPRSEIDDAGVRRLWEKGFLWNAEADRRAQPYFIHKGLVRLPITNDDWPLHRGAVSVERYVDDFAAALRSRPYVAFGFHDTIASFDPEPRLRLWERLVRMAHDGHATLVTFSEAADLFRRAIVADYYTRTARAWNTQTRALYRTTRLREIVRAEATRLGAPIVADLGSGGGVLASAVADIAQAVHCVDNAPGMVADAQRAGLGASLGEATDSGLADHVADLVVCARIIEYLFWPERLAGEIRRIGKVGGCYIVTFPARGMVAPSNEGTPPDRIRRYFAAEEVHAWAAAVGPGRLVPLQYEAAEPADAEMERRYRLLETDPPADRIPTNWVFIGTIAAGAVPARARTVPLSAAPFRFDREGSGVLARLRSLARGFRQRAR